MGKIAENTVNTFSFLILKLIMYELVYVDFGTLSSDTIMFGFDFGTTASTTNIWDIKVTQITCGSIIRYVIRIKGVATRIMNS